VSIRRDLTLRKAITHRRECGRHQQLIDDVADDLTVFLGLGAAMIHSGSLWKAAHFFSRSASDSQQQVRQFLIGFADQRGENRPA